MNKFFLFFIFTFQAFSQNYPVLLKKLDPLINNNQTVTSKKCDQRRPELLNLLKENIYGYEPQKQDYKLSFNVFETIIIKEKSSSNAIVEYVDITPTLIDIAGGEPLTPLDGKSFKRVLYGQTDHHKEYVYGIVTIRGKLKGSKAFAIRSIRSDRYELILNLNHENKFTNAYTKSTLFKSMVQKADSGDAHARALVSRSIIGTFSQARF